MLYDFFFAQRLYYAKNLLYGYVLNFCLGVPGTPWNPRRIAYADGNYANVFSPVLAKRVWLNMEVDSLNRVGVILCQVFNFESFF